MSAPELVAASGSVPPSLELLSYYRSRIAEFEKERELFLSKFSAVEERGNQVDRLKWELKVREDEVMELHKALSDANVYLYDEREQVLKLQAENDSLKIQEIEDRRRIQHLLALTQPVTQEVTFFRDCRPEKVTHYHDSASVTTGAGIREGKGGRPATAAGSALTSGSPMSIAGSVSGSPSVGGASGMTKGSSDDKSGQSRVLRTVYLPSDRADALLLTVQSLQQQLEECRKLMDKRTEAWRVDREEREKVHRRKADADAALIATLEKDLGHTKETLQKTTQEYLTQRHTSQSAQRQLREKAAALQATNTKLVADIEELREATEAEIERVKAAAKRESMQFREYARQQAQQREDDLRLLKEQYAEVQAMYEARVKTVEAKLTQSRKKFKALEKRRNLELEGFTADISTLRRALMQLETQWAVMHEVATTAAATSGMEASGVSLAPDSSMPSTSFRSSRTVSGLRVTDSKSRLQASSSADGPSMASTSFPTSSGSSRFNTTGRSASKDTSTLSWRVKSSGYGESNRPKPRRTRKSRSGPSRRTAWPPAHHTHRMRPKHRGGPADDLSEEDLDSERELSPSSAAGAPDATVPSLASTSGPSTAFDSSAASTRQAAAAASLRGGVTDVAQRVAALQQRISHTFEEVA